MSIRIIILGAGGFIGSRLAASLATQGALGYLPIAELVLFDRSPLPLRRGAGCLVTSSHGDLRDAGVLDALFAEPVDVIFHLAATLTLDAEADFRRGLETNVLAFVELLERCRAQTQTRGRAPMLLFASSISTFGGVLPDVVGDDVFQAPTTSYGTHKVIAEQLLVDYSRHGFVDGRALRLPIILTHPGPASGSVSDQVASLIREPLRGGRANCRMRANSQLVVASVDNVVASFIRLALLEIKAMEKVRTLNLPGLVVTPADIVRAVGQKLGGEHFVDWLPDTQVQQIIDGWPQDFTSQRALALGFTRDDSVHALVDAFLASEEVAP